MGQREVTLEAAEHIQTSWLLPSIQLGFLGTAVTFRGQLSQQCALSRAEEVGHLEFSFLGFWEILFSLLVHLSFLTCSLMDYDKRLSLRDSVSKMTVDQKGFVSSLAGVKFVTLSCRNTVVSSSPCHFKPFLLEFPN